MKVIKVPDAQTPDNGVILYYDWDTDTVSLISSDLPEYAFNLNRTDVAAIMNLFDGKED